MNWLHSKCRLMTTLFVVMVCWGLAIAQDVDETFRQRLDAHVHEHRVPGMVFVLLEDGQIVFEHSTGYLDRGERTPATLETVFRLASISKPITAVGVMRLVEEGRLDLDADVRGMIPEMPEGPPVTLRQLLAHTSGVRHYVLGRADNGFRRFESVSDALSLFVDDPLMFEPGTDRQYSTHAYTLVARAIEVASARAFTEFMDDEVLIPGVGYERREREDPLRSELYETYGDFLVIESARAQDNSWKDAGGGMEASAVALASWADQLLGEEIVGAESLRQMWTDQSLANGEPTGYGLGWDLIGDGLVGHSGAQQGSRCVLLLDPDRRRVAVLLSNYQNHNPFSMVVEYVSARP